MRTNDNRRSGEAAAAVTSAGAPAVRPIGPALELAWGSVDRSAARPLSR
jgi:hypothetical protein